MQIRPLEARDVEAILAVQSASPEIAQWTVWDYNRVASGEMAGWVAQENGDVIGFLVARRVATDIEILNFAVRPAARRRGAGSLLLRRALAWGGDFQAERALLEMRVSNLAALRFYARHNFHVAGRRSRYYAAPIEDALLLAASLE